MWQIAVLLMRYKRFYPKETEHHLLKSGQLCIWLAEALIVILIIVAITACAQIHSVTVFPDGRKVTTDALEIGSTVALKDFHDSMTATGREVSVGSANEDVNVKAIDAFGSLIGTAVGAGVKAAK
jgi:predicted RecA/RadA family phage recombinase